MTTDAVFWTHGAEPLVGRQALADAFAPFFENFLFIQDYDCHELIVRGDRAFVRGLERNKRIPHDGGEAVIVKQRAFSVLHRSANGQWRFSRGMSNKPAEE
ncbi:YybH family protein [Marinicella gelatinilytica]|uniref:YybH family protein n=1 Tax=Marinicella gelatinilytica TaxID=2996017 RepID=UPI0022608D73|nr:nuclear transport factor 2 family protein [Marinicella gelatinilytica]MCX7545145.1 nuclear transport factor 2 family protein [Marinicella gelatinilytica]